jgi:flagellar assembly protein FliH
VGKKSSFKPDAAVRLYIPVQFEEKDKLPEKISAGDRTHKINEEDPHARIKIIENAGYEKGYAAGYEKGIRDGENEVSEKLKRLEGIIIELENYRAKKTNELLPDIIGLSMEIAKKVIHKEVELDKNVVMYVVNDAVKKIEEREEKITIKVNPLDYGVMLSNIDVLKEQTGLKSISVESISSISPGGCYIETHAGEIDARIEEQIRGVENAIGTATDREM